MLPKTTSEENYTLGIYNQKETRVGGVTLPQIGGVQVVGKVVDTGSAASARICMAVR